MSIRPGTTKLKDPDGSLFYTWDWQDWLGAAAQIQTSTFLVTGPDAALTTDNPTIIAGGKSATVRVLGGTLGATYTLTHRIVTNETPTQGDDRSIFIRVQTL